MKTVLQQNREIEAIALRLVSSLKEAGYEASYFVGGYVRDKILGIDPDKLIDIDIATEARPANIKRVFRGERFIEVGESFNIVIVVIDGYKFEIATFREDRFHPDQAQWNGRHPDSVSFATAEEDAMRRDFTINGIFYDPLGQRHIDYVNGLADIKKKIIRTIGEPIERFREDYLRMLRAIRFAVQKSFRIDKAVLDGIRSHAERIVQISKERIVSELEGILLSIRSDEGLKLLRDCGLLKWLFLKSDSDFIPVDELQFESTLSGFRLAPRDRLLRWTLFFRFLNFYYQDLMHIKTLLQENKFDNKTRDSILWVLEKLPLIESWNRMGPYEQMSLAVAVDFKTLFRIHAIDCQLKGKSASADTIDALCQRFQSDPLRWEQMKKFTLLNGNDLVKLGIRGKQIGELLEQAKQKYILGELHSRQALLSFIQNAIAE